MDGQEVVGRLNARHVTVMSRWRGRENRRHLPPFPTADRSLVPLARIETDPVLIQIHVTIRCSSNVRSASVEVLGLTYHGPITIASCICCPLSPRCPRR